MMVRFAFIILLIAPQLLLADDLCEDRDVFLDDGWEHQAVKDAMDIYLREHRMHANWLDQPAPPDQIGRDYYQWLWHNNFGAAMKRNVVEQFCGNASATDAD